MTISQSGETADTLTAVRGAKDRGAAILGITNVMGSTLTRLSDVYIGQNSGPEMGVAATKTFTAQFAVLVKIAVVLAEKRKTLSGNELQLLEAGFDQLPEWVSTTLSSQEDQVKRLAEKFIDRVSFCFLGRGISVATALEGRLKLLELSYLPAIAYPAGESKHGFISVVEDGYPVIFIAPMDEVYSKIVGNVMEMKARQCGRLLVWLKGGMLKLRVCRIIRLLCLLGFLGLSRRSSSFFLSSFSPITCR